MEPLEEMPTDLARVLAIVAHPDDLEYGASAAVADWTGRALRRSADHRVWLMGG